MLDWIDEIEITEDTEALETPKEFKFDFRTHTFTDEIVTGLEAIKIWAYLALSTPRYKSRIYSWDYGSDLEELIGKERALVESEAGRMVRECLTQNPFITDAETTIVETEDDKIKLLVTIITDFGEDQLELETNNV